MLTEKEIQNLKSKLEKERADMTALLNGVQKADARNMGDDITEYDDEEADEAEELATAIGVAGPTKERLETIKATLFKIEQGKYGFCEKCGAEVEKEILEVDPESRWCKVCKVEINKTG